jgi:hypothetical protein
MIKSLISALALSLMATIGLAGIVQAQQRCLYPPGTSNKGCIPKPITPTTPQLPKQ